MKSSRLVEILLLLQAKSSRSATELANALEVTARTIYRDVDALSAAGVPIYTIRGPQGGIALREGYRQAISQLKEDEIGALFISGADPLVDLGLGDKLGAAREKLFGALTDRQRALAVKAGGRIRIDLRQWAQGRQPLETLALMRIAVWEDRSVQILYRDQKGATTERRLDPLGIVFKAGVWYVAARVGIRVATFRAERILSTQLLKKHFERPGAFDLGKYWEKSVQHYEKKAISVVATVRGSKQTMEQLAVFWPTCISAQSNDLTLQAQVTFPLHGIAVRELVVWSAELEVLAPTRLRDEVCSRLQAGISRYKLDDQKSPCVERKPTGSRDRKSISHKG